MRQSVVKVGHQITFTIIILITFLCRCRSDEEVREMKDVYMDNMLMANNGSENNLDDCPIVIRFRKELSC